MDILEIANAVFSEIEREEVVALFYTKMGIDKKSIKKSLKSQ